jgi:hypothetical protein
MFVESAHRYKSSFDGMAACHQAANAFAPAVQDLINKAITDPKFASLLK